ncbi:MAG TPA: hypothetical protein VHA73_10145 [Acidimicrobiales bacterium]|jgi:hypothetical protein|nr:hypothetical protein [Acidimicrobiales bacterium]
MAVTGHADGSISGGLECFALEGGSGDQGGSRIAFFGDALLFSLQQVEWHGTGVVGVQQLGAFVIELAEAGLLAFGLGGCRILLATELSQDGRSRIVESLGCQLDDSVVLLNAALDPLERPVREHAGGALLVPAHAEVVRVTLAGLAPGVRDTQP